MQQKRRSSSGLVSTNKIDFVFVPNNCIFFTCDRSGPDFVVLQDDEDYALIRSETNYHHDQEDHAVGIRVFRRSRTEKAQTEIETADKPGKCHLQRNHPGSMSGEDSEDFCLIWEMTGMVIVCTSDTGSQQQPETSTEGGKMVSKFPKHHTSYPVA